MSGAASGEEAAVAEVARPRLPVLPEGPAGEAPPLVRGEALWRRFEKVMLAWDRWLGRAVPAGWNPLARTGAVANVTLIIATLSGVLLLVWYTPSVHGAYDSVVEMARAPFGAGLVRTLHRYSSDACMFFALLHALRVFLERRFTRPRWIAWVSGLAMVGVLWLVGWTGYWLVWDDRAQLVATGTATVVDALPIFADALPREFLTDATVQSLLFFLVFFLHMLLPLGIAAGLWLHLSRTRRSDYLTGWGLSAWILVSLTVLSALAPADLGARAAMQTTPQGFASDGWYLWPLAFTERLGVGAIWSLLCVGGVVLAAVPWWMTRRRAVPAVVEPSRCHGCAQCFEDCPVGAIRMVPRTDGQSALPAQALVDPALCVSCGICSGSCKTAGIDLPGLQSLDVRAVVEGWLAEAKAQGEAPPAIAFLCAESGGRTVRVDARTGRAAELPGYRVLRVPCIAWVQTVAVERALRRGAAGILLVGCAPESCHFREGVRWAAARLSGERAPVLEPSHVDARRVRLVGLSPLDAGTLAHEAAAFLRALREGTGATPPGTPGWPRRLLVGAVATAALCAVTWVGTLLPWTPAGDGQPELIVSFKHAGQLASRCRERSQAELDALPVHMRVRQVCERGRSPVRLRVFVDGAPVVERAYAPKGLWGDGNSIAIERVPLREGTHRVRVELDDAGTQSGPWPHVQERTLALRPFHRRVVLFDKEGGLRWF